MSNIKIKYKENEYEYESGISLLEISKNFKNDFKENIDYCAHEGNIRQKMKMVI